MTGTDVAIAGTQVPARNGAIVLSAEARTRLNALGEAWTEAQWQLVTYSPARDDTWAEKVIKDLSGAKLEIDKIAQGYQSVLQSDQQAEIRRKAMESFIETTLRRIELIAIEAPTDASSILLAWMNRLASRVADLADQASKLTAAHKNMLDKVDVLRSEKGSATAVSAKLQQGIGQMQQLLWRVTGQPVPDDTDHAVNTDRTNGGRSDIDQVTNKAIKKLKKQRQEAETALSNAEQKARTAVEGELQRALARQLRGVKADLKKTVAQVVKREATTAVNRQLKATRRP